MEETLSVLQGTAVSLVTDVTGAQLIWLGLSDRCCVGLWLSVSGLMEPFGSRPTPALWIRPRLLRRPFRAVSGAGLLCRGTDTVSVSPAFGPHTGDMSLYYLIECSERNSRCLVLHTHTHSFTNTQMHAHIDLIHRGRVSLFLIKYYHLSQWCEVGVGLFVFLTNGQWEQCSLLFKVVFNCLYFQNFTHKSKKFARWIIFS